jgi:hypothetical protein
MAGPAFNMPVIVVSAPIWLESLSHYRNRKNRGLAAQD